MLPSGSRAATTATDELSTPNGSRGIIVYLNLTVRGAAETVTPSIQVKDPASGTWMDYVTFSATAAVGEYPLLLTNLSVAPDTVAAFVTPKKAPLPSRYRINLAHSGATAHTYSVSVEDLT